MAQIIQFEITSDVLLKQAEMALEDNNILKHVECLKNAIKLDPKCHEASLRLAQAYANLGTLDYSNEVIFQALNQGVDEEYRELFCVQLAMNYADDGQDEVAQYYLRDYLDFDINHPYPEKLLSKNGLRLVHPRGEDYYQGLIEQAYQLVREHRLDDAIALMDRVDSSSKSKEAANHIVLICLMLKNDVDSVIENAKQMLAKDGDSLVVKCTLATAYMMEDRLPEAYATVDELLNEHQTRDEDLLLLLPLLVNLEMHNEVVKYANRVLVKHKWQPNTMMWLSNALYNIGQKKIAVKMMRDVDTLYGDYIDAKYYLELYEQRPPQVAYAMSPASTTRFDRIRQIENLLQMSYDNLLPLLTDESEDCLKTRELIEWAMLCCNDKLRIVLARKLAVFMTEWTDGLFRRALTHNGQCYEAISIMLIAIMNEPVTHVDLNLVAQERFKELSIDKPPAYFEQSEFLHSATDLAVAEIAFTDEEPNEYIGALFDVLNELSPMIGSRNPATAKRLQKIAKLRSLNTAVGVLLGKVYKDEESREEIIERYELNPRTYDKYLKIFFGEDNGED